MKSSLGDNSALNATCDTGLDGGFDIQISTARSDPAWDMFLANTRSGHHVQSSLWAQVKALNHWKPVRIIASAGGNIVGGVQLLIRALPFSSSVIYVSKGPTILEANHLLAGDIIRYIIWVSHQHHAHLLAIQPPKGGEEIALLLQQMGFEQSSLELAPIASLVLDLRLPTEQILAEMKRQTRQNIRRGEKMGLMVREGTQKDLDSFYELHRATSQRQGFYPYPKNYYSHMWSIFGSQDLIHLFMVEHKGRPITGLLVISFGDTVIAKILGWSGECPELRPNDAAFWGAVQWSKSHGYHYFDFEGISAKCAEARLDGQHLPVASQTSSNWDMAARSWCAPLPMKYCRIHYYAGSIEKHRLLWTVTHLFPG